MRCEPIWSICATHINLHTCCKRFLRLNLWGSTMSQQEPQNVILHDLSWYPMVPSAPRFPQVVQKETETRLLMWTLDCISVCTSFMNQGSTKIARNNGQRSMASTRRSKTPPRGDWSLEMMRIEWPPCRNRNQANQSRCPITFLRVGN